MLHRMDIVSMLLIMLLLWAAVLFFNKFCESAGGGSGVCDALSLAMLASHTGFLLATACRFGHLFSLHHQDILRRRLTGRKVPSTRTRQMFNNPLHAVNDPDECLAHNSKKALELPRLPRVGHFGNPLHQQGGKPKC